MLADADTYMGNNRVVQEGDRIADITVYQDNDTYEISAFEDYDFTEETECTADVDDCAEEEDGDDSDEDGECETDDEDCETDGEGPSDDEEDSCETDDEDCEADDSDEEDSCETDDEDCEADDDDDDDEDGNDESETPDSAFSLATSTAAIAMAAVFAF